MSLIETLKKIDYQDLNQFKEDINYNFAVIQNSPLYKGIPGNEGADGVGIRGIRGIKFLFVNLQKFQAQFPGELSNSSQIDINYINTKLLTFENKNKLLTAFDVTEFVDKDVIVLVNTIMIYYDLLENKCINTGIAFNEQSNLLNNIQQQIENYVQYYIGINQTINNITNIFEGYSTLAKNYADTNNTFVTNDLTQSSIYSPFIPGYNSNIGINIGNHKYFGFSDTQFPLNNNGTTVFGNMKRYYQLLMSTISTDSNQTLTSDYSPGVGNIPSLVILQDTEKAGLLIGYKSRQNLKRFGSIYKNDIHELVLKSDSGVNPSEYSELKLHRQYMKFDKLVQFSNDLEVSRDAKLFADISNKFIKSGKFSQGADVDNNFNPHILEVGRRNGDAGIAPTIVKNVSEFEEYIHYINNVFITDGIGRVSKDYSLETTPLPNGPLIGLNNISELINSPYKILTSYYYGYLARKINNISNFVNGNYWRKNQYETGEIPGLVLSDSLTVHKDTNLANLIKVVANEGKTYLGGNTLQTITTPNIKYDWFGKNVLITDGNGILLNTYSLETNALPLSELVFGVPLNIWSESEYKILSTKYYAHLAKKINGIAVGLAENYWTKEEWETGVIPYLNLNSGLYVNGGVTFVANSNVVFNINPITGQINIGSPTTSTVLQSNSIKLTQFINKVLVTGADGTILNQYMLDTNWFNNNDLPGNNLITIPNILGEDNYVSRRPQIVWLAQKINNIITWFTANTWLKPQFPTGEIPALLTNNSLGTNGNFRAGEAANPNISTSGNTTIIGKVGGLLRLVGNSIRFDNRPNIVVVTDSNGDVVNNYGIENSHPNSGPGTGGWTDSEIYADYWIKNLLPNQPFLDYPNNINKVVTSNYFSWIVSHLKAIRTLLYDRPTFNELGNQFMINSPNGIIVYWNNAFGDVPVGWVVCDGRYIPGLTVRTPNMMNKYTKSSLTPNVLSGNENNQVTLLLPNIPSHNHNMPAHTHGIPFPIDGGGNQEIQSITDTNNSDERWVNNYTTSAPGGNGPTGNTGGNTAVSGNPTVPFNVEPYNITLIPIMKFWNGVGEIPVVNLPSFATITNISQNANLLRVTLTVSYEDTTVSNFNVERSIDDGATWQVAKVVHLQPNFVGNVDVTTNGAWKFRLKALNGDSAFTNGQYSPVSDFTVNVPWANLSNLIQQNGGLSITLGFSRNDQTVDLVTLQRSTDNVTFNDIETLTTTNNFTTTLPSALDTYYFRLKAANGNSINSLTNTITYQHNLLQLFPITISGMAIGTFIGKTRFVITVNVIDPLLTGVTLEEYSTASGQWLILPMDSWVNVGPTTTSITISFNPSAVPVPNTPKSYRLRVSTVESNPGYGLYSNVWNHTP